jgi:hypothetical protein
MAEEDNDATVQTSKCPTTSNYYWRTNMTHPIVHFNMLCQQF